MNPAAGRGRAGRVREAVLRAAAAAWGAVDAALTEGPGHAVALARAAAEAGARRIVVVGGDGTLHEAANGLLRSDAGGRPALGVVPVGTGNDFAKLTGLHGAAPDDAVRRLAAGRVRCFDVGRAGDEYFVNAMGVGLDAEVARRINRPSCLRGAAAYLAALAGAWAGFRPVRLTVDADGERLDGPLLLLEVAIGRCVGGAFRLTPGALPDDGLFDLCAIRPVGLLGLVTKVRHVFRGSHGTLDEVRLLRASRVVLRSGTGPIISQLDGEIRSLGPEVTITVEPRRLPVMVAA